MGKVALFGKMRSGKDTVAEILINQYGYTKFAFGDGIGEIISKYFPEAYAKGKPRKHYQYIGQSLRALNKDVWVNYLFRTIDNYENSFALIDKPFNPVITDGRQFNEAERLREEGFLIVKVEAPEEKRIERMIASGDVFEATLLQHETEKQVDLIKPDIIITNNGTLEELREQIEIKILGGINKC